MTDGIRRDSTSSSQQGEKTTGDKNKATLPLQPIAPSSTNTTHANSPLSKPTASPRSTVPPTKRRKVSIACHECRTHKTKCDGAQPICGSCRKKKLPEDACAYSPERGRRGVKNQYVQLLEDKVKELQSAISKSQEQQHQQSNVIQLPPLTATVMPSMDNRLIQQSHLNIPSSPSDNSITPRPLRLSTAASAPTITASTASPRRHTEGSIQSLLTPTSTAEWQQQPTTTIQHSPSSSQQDADDSQQEASAIDAMGAVTSDSNNQGEKELTRDHHGQGYFGSSSAGRFMKQLHDVIDKKTASAAVHPSNGSNHSQGSPNSINSTIRSNPLQPQRRFSTTDLLSDIVLPPRKVADGLLESYWVYVHTLYPFLHKPSFLKTYSMLWDHSSSTGNSNSSSSTADGPYYDLYESENEPLFQCTLNLVFALGCQLSPDTNENEREVASDVFFQRSKKLLHFDILEAGNIKVVQALLLMGQYLQCTKLPGRCWIVVGLAIRVAQGIGLHLERKSENQLDRELRRRLWGGCIVLDRVISMAYGRPFMIPISRDLKLPQVIDDELLTVAPHPPAQQPASKPSQMAFLVHTIKLYEIMGEILLTLYSDGDTFGGAVDHASPSARSEIDGDNLATSLNSILKLEMALCSWKQDLPPFLQHDQSRNAIFQMEKDELESKKLLRQCNVLKARYLHVCILLYRPLLVFYFTLEESTNHQHNTSDQTTATHTATDLQRSLFVQSSQKCVMIAQDLIKTISHNIKAQLPAWWYSIFYLYTAATVLLMARLFPKIRDVIGEESLLSSWNECLRCMGEYQHYSVSAKKCYSYLSELENHVWAATHDQQDKDTSTMMSSIQILGTLPQRQQMNGQIQLQELPIQNEHSSNHQQQQQQHLQQQQQTQQATTEYTTTAFNYNHSNIENWDFDLMQQDMSWLGRLPVYTDLESEYQNSLNGWGGFSFL
ncbi:fungal-specific transcription factor domain-containing protein [Mucor lusitanicus]|uniref:Fungal-specific transcription factor domain-containing protein n=1 Tax=Mucor circinelloides f. lusitanicus TaxID=29924 RepID=A0A8H4B627_MUCCL|nr:fungal-specific transcription factor domain-containing protein [Mucor lusitanicus]